MVVGLTMFGIGKPTHVRPRRLSQYFISLI